MTSAPVWAAPRYQRHVPLIEMWAEHQHCVLKRNYVVKYLIELGIMQYPIKRVQVCINLTEQLKVEQFNCFCRKRTFNLVYFSKNESKKVQTIMKFVV